MYILGGLIDMAMQFPMLQYGHTYMRLHGNVTREFTSRQPRCITAIRIRTAFTDVAILAIAGNTRSTRVSSTGCSWHDVESRMAREV